jgi:hypothetical protein
MLRYGGQAQRSLADLLRRGSRPQAVEKLHAATDAEISNGHNVESAQIENKKHVDSPGANSGESREALNDFGVGKPV